MFINILYKIISPIKKYPIYFILFIIYNFLGGGKMNLSFVRGALLNPQAYRPLFYELFPIGVIFTIAYLFCLLMSVINKKWFSAIVMVLTFSLLLVSAFLQWNFESSISPTILTMIVETTGKESSEFLKLFLFSQKSLFLYSSFLGIALIVNILNKLLQKRIKNNNKFKFYVSIGTFILLVPSFCMFVWSYLFYSQILFINTTTTLEKTLFVFKSKDPEYNYDPFSSLFISVNELRIFSSEMDKAINKSLEISQRKSVYSDLSETDSLQIVVVIGESFSKYHAHYYGYPLQTTPFLNKEKKEGNLFIFNDVASPANSTSISLKNTLYCNSIGDGENWGNYPYFPTIFKTAGFGVYYWDNQKPMGNIQIECFPNLSLSQCCYQKDLRKVTYDEVNKQTFPFDAELIKDFKNNIILKNPNNLILFHLYGQHFDYKERYPNSFKCFTRDSIKRKEDYLTPDHKQVIAEYDNATLYNDYVLSLILNIFAQKNAIVIYFSDHGEQIYDYQDKVSRTQTKNPDKNILKYEYTVPFVVWCSHKFKTKYPTKIKELNNAINRPFMLDNLCQMLFNIGKINTDYYKANRDILNESYTCPPRIILSNLDYDKIISQH